MWGMPEGFAALIQRKYDIMQQEANDRGIGLRAAANLDATRAGLLPGQTAADIAQSKANTAGQLETNKTIAPLAASTIGLNTSNVRQNTAQAGYLDSEAAANRGSDIGYGLRSFLKQQSDPLARMRNAITSNYRLSDF